mmetsp:Transcript_4373/g.16474  ORF Transcript_4373/g.16474 Transcript_4373/m.16474 type:complete len:611 (-) Transcript_4373:5231-7063(-)
MTPTAPLSPQQSEGSDTSSLLVSEVPSPVRRLSIEMYSSSDEHESLTSIPDYISAGKDKTSSSDDDEHLSRAIFQNFDSSQTFSFFKKQHYLYRRASRSYDDTKYLSAMKFLNQVDLIEVQRMENVMMEAVKDGNANVHLDEKEKENRATQCKENSLLRQGVLSLKGRVLMKLNKPFEALPIFLQLFHIPTNDRNSQLHCAFDLVKLHESLYCYDHALFYSNYILDGEVKLWLQEKVKMNAEYENVYKDKVKEGMRREIVFCIAKMLQKANFGASNCSTTTDSSFVSDKKFEQIRTKINKHMLKYTLKSQYKTYHPSKPISSQWKKQWDAEDRNDHDRIVNLDLWRQILTPQLDTIKRLVEFVNNCTITDFSRKKILSESKDSPEKVRHTRWTCSYKNKPFFQFEYYSEYDPICEETHFCKRIDLLRNTTDKQMLWYEKPYNKIDTYSKWNEYKARLSEYIRENQWQDVSTDEDFLYDLVCSFGRDNFHATCSLSGYQNHTTPDKVPPLTIFVREVQSPVARKFFKIEDYQTWFQQHKEEISRYHIQFHRNVSITGSGQSLSCEDRDRILFSEERAENVQTAAKIRNHAKELLMPRKSDFSQIVGSLLGR